MITEGALLFGLATSLHCVGMCGPIACGLSSMAKSDGQRMWGITLYHVGRIISYASIGAVCGFLGQQPLKWFFDSPVCLLPWVLVAVLLLIAFGWDRRLPRPMILQRLALQSKFQIQKYSGTTAALAMGLASPFLPCGPLYAAFGTALLTGSGLLGAEYMAAFALGTVPLLWLTQSQYHHIRAALSPTTMTRVRRAVALVTALMLMWRLHGTIPPAIYGGEAKPTGELPSCCH